jgi:hypothetical protein
VCPVVSMLLVPVLNEYGIFLVRSIACWIILTRNPPADTLLRSVDRLISRHIRVEFETAERQLMSHLKISG